jgi:hypothetical protein
MKRLTETVFGRDGAVLFRCMISDGPNRFAGKVQ